MNCILYQNDFTLTWSSVLQLEVLIFKLVAVDALAASAVLVGEITTLAHETWDDTVERAPLVAKSFLTWKENI